MADTAITVVQLNKDVSYRQAQMPVYSYGTYVADDTDYHSLIVDGRGKGRFSYCVDNQSNQDVLVTLYGMHAADGAVGDTGTFAIDSTGKTAAATSKVYDTCNDPFPFYLIRCKQAATPDSKTVTVYADFSAF